MIFRVLLVLFFGYSFYKYYYYLWELLLFFGCFGHKKLPEHDLSLYIFFSSKYSWHIYDRNYFAVMGTFIIRWVPKIIPYVFPYDIPYDIPVENHMPNTIWYTIRFTIRFSIWFSIWYLIWIGFHGILEKIKFYWTSPLFWLLMFVVIISFVINQSESNSSMNVSKFAQCKTMTARSQNVEG